MDSTVIEMLVHASVALITKVESWDEEYTLLDILCTPSSAVWEEVHSGKASEIKRTRPGDTLRVGI
jgi:hypothetical protein